MFNRKTVFVLGAGASAEVGLPVGTALAKDIATRVFVSVSHFGNIEKTNDDNLWRAITRKYGGELGQFVRAAKTVREGIALANSIDDFLNIHSADWHLVRLGKAAIVGAILHAEERSKLYVDPSNIYNKLKYDGIEPTWFVKFMRVLGPGITVANVERIFENTVFIVFNYDRCIEQFLSHALQHLYALNRDAALRIVASAKFIHPYGSIGALARLRFGGDPHDTIDPLELSEDIRTYAEADTEASPDLKSAIAQSECIVFLGSAFHRQNMRLLKPEKNIYGKQIFGTAFGMSDADRDFVVRELYTYFGSSGGDTNHIHIANVPCATLFDTYAKSLAG